MLVDTCVWSLLLHRKKSVLHPAIKLLSQAIRDKNRVFITGIVFQEVLQGIRDDSYYEKIKDYLLYFDWLNPDFKTHDRAAQILRKFKSHGVTSHTNDCLIASLAIEQSTPILTTDKDFSFIAKHTSLKLVDF